ncbi:Thymidylate kinase [Streptomyces sp. RB5]|uniref:Thymidylate kinase n=1 Tax=Streptomyces smaragdinus TaxID=2585196 RepID=A0A7K0CTI9_9ACTN|nr:dTMP kinase [Streptomyces smaragdinus]MQY16806.1 Thymidylate kinase [Streptomyces smaragdinus]
MNRAEQNPVGTHPTDSLAADSRERAVKALLRHPPLRRLWGAELIGGIGDALALLVLTALTVQAAGAESMFGEGYRGTAIAVAAVFAVRILATLLFGAVLLGPLTQLTGAKGPLDKRWTMIVADVLRVGLLLVAPLWIDWTPDRALTWLLVTAFVGGAAERLWTVAKDGAAPALLPAPPAEGAAVRALPDHYEALRRLSLRTAYLAVPAAAAALLAITLVSNLLGSGIEWFHLHQVALGSYLAAGLFAASITVLYFLELPDSDSRRPRSPLEGLRRPRSLEGDLVRGRTGAIPVLVLTGAAVAGAVAAATAIAVLQARDLGGGPVTYALLVLAFTGGPGLGIRLAPKVLPVLSRRRLLALATAVAGLALLAVGLIGDTATSLGVALLAGIAAGVAAATGHTLLDQETEAARQARVTAHLHAVVRLVIALAAIAAPLLAAVIGRHRVESGDFVFDHDGSAFAYLLIGALLLPVAALALAKTDDRQGVPLRRDLRDALRRGAEPDVAPSATGYFIAVEGGDGAGKSTQVEALAEWIRGKGHDVVVTREPGATSIGQRLRSILLDVSSAGISHRAEALLYAADRAEHVDSVIRPALERGAVVITDRYIDSSVAYQGAGRDLSPTEIARISRWATDGLVPHLTVLLDISPEVARERFTEAPDRLESEPAEFHERVRSGFLTLAAADPARYLIVDAAQDPEDVATVVRHRLDQLLPLSETEVRAQEEARRRAEEEARRRAEEEAARKAEEERQERERQEQIARLRAEEEERRRHEIEEAKRLEAEREAEYARRRAEEAARIAAEERQRREAEEAAYRAEQERLRRLAEEQARLRAEAEEKRLEKQRRAEEALLRAERERDAAADSEATRELPATGPDAEETLRVPAVPDPDVTRPLPQVPDPDGEETRVIPQVPSPGELPEDRVPESYFRPSGGARQRPTWAEETPLDDLPSLADELLGRDEDERRY